MKRPATIIPLLLATLLIAASSMTFAAAPRSTSHAVAVGGKLYTIERSGQLYAVDLANGKYTPLGKPEFQSTMYLFPVAGGLLRLGQDGGLSRIDTADGSARRVGKAGEWSNTSVATMNGDTLYWIDREGVMFATDTSTGQSRRITQDLVRVKYLWGGGSVLHAIEFDGSMYTIGLDGRKDRVGTPNDWVETRIGALHGGKLITIEGSGGMFQTDLKSGAWTQIGRKEFGTIQFLLSTGGGFYLMDFSGELYKLDTATGVRTLINKP